MKSTVMAATSFALVLGTISFAAPQFFNQSVNALTNTVNNQAEFEAALGGSDDTISISTGFSVNKQINVDRAVTINGNGNTISTGFNFVDNSNNSAITIRSNDVTVNNVVIDGSAATATHGINVFAVTGVTLNNITTKNNDKDGLGINGSTVLVHGISTSSNGWGGVDVDQGSGVTTPAQLTITGTSIHNETNADVRIDDIAKQATVVDSLNQYNLTHYGNLQVFKLKPDAPKNLRLNGDKVCGYATNVNYITPTWDAVPGATSYNYKAVTPSGAVYGPTSIGNVTSVSGVFGGEGVSTFSVQTVTPNGLSNWASSCEVTYDNTKPSLPELLTTPDNGFQQTNNFNFTWTASIDASSVKYEFQSSGNNTIDSNGSLVGAWNSIANGNGEQNNLTTPMIYSTGAPDSTYYWQVRAIDAAGNKSDWTPVWKMTIDSVAPLSPKNLILKDSDNNQIVNNGTTKSYAVTATWDGVSDATRYEYKYWNNISTSVYNTEATAYIVTNGLSLSRSGVLNQGEGMHYIQVRAFDAAGNPSPWSATSVVEYDTIPTVLTIDQISNSTNTTPTIRGTTDEVGEPVTVSVNGVDYSAIVNTDGTWSAKVDVPLAVGTYTATARSSDVAGNMPTISFAITQPVVVVQNENIATPTTASFPLSEELSTSIANIVATDGSSALTTDNSSSALRNTDDVVPAEDVLGAQTKNDGDVLGAETTAAISPTTQGWKILGMMWYWWALIFALTGGIWWFIAARYRRQAQDV